MYVYELNMEKIQQNCHQLQQKKVWRTQIKLWRDWGRGAATAGRESSSLKGYSHFYLSIWRHLLRCNWQCHTSFRCVTQWFDIYTHCGMVPLVSLAPLFSPYNVIDVQYIPVSYLFHYLKYALSNPLHPFCSPFPNHPSLWQPPLCKSGFCSDLFFKFHT